jgi:hypothetical protein
MATCSGRLHFFYPEKREETGRNENISNTMYILSLVKQKNPFAYETTFIVAGLSVSVTDRPA